MAFSLLMLWLVCRHSISLTVDELKHQNHRCQPDKNDVGMDDVSCVFDFCFQIFILNFNLLRNSQFSEFARIVLYMCVCVCVSVCVYVWGIVFAVFDVVNCITI